MAYDKGQYCDFCMQIYVDTGVNAEIDGKEWIDCDSCKKWIHTQCEIENGNEQLAKLQE